MRLLLITTENSNLNQPLLNALTAGFQAADGKFDLTLGTELSDASAQTDDKIDLAIVALDWPDQYSAAAIEAAVAATPSTRWICCYGPWCEGDGRNRENWPTATRVSLDQFPQRLQQEIEILNDQRAPLPLTASRNECFLFDQEGLPQKNDAPPTQPERSQTSKVKLVTDDSAIRELYSLFLRTEEYEVETLTNSQLVNHLKTTKEPIEGQTIWLLDLDPWNERQQRLVKQLTASIHSPALSIGLTNEINIELRQEMQTAGLSEINSKLTGQSDLLTTLARVQTEGSTKT